MFISCFLFLFALIQIFFNQRVVLLIFRLLSLLILNKEFVSDLLKMLFSQLEPCLSRHQFRIQTINKQHALIQVSFGLKRLWQQFVLNFAEPSFSNRLELSVDSWGKQTCTAECVQSIVDSVHVQRLGLHGLLVIAFAQFYLKICLNPQVLLFNLVTNFNLAVKSISNKIFLKGNRSKLIIVPLV